MRKRIGTYLVATLAFLMILFSTAAIEAAPAFAHTGSFTATCSTLTFSYKRFPNTTPVHVTATVGTRAVAVTTSVVGQGKITVDIHQWTPGVSVIPDATASWVWGSKKNRQTKTIGPESVVINGTCQLPFSGTTQAVSRCQSNSGLYDVGLDITNTGKTPFTVTSSNLSDHLGVGQRLVPGRAVALDDPTVPGYVFQGGYNLGLRSDDGRTASLHGLFVGPAPNGHCSKLVAIVTPLPKPQMIPPATKTATNCDHATDAQVANGTCLGMTGLSQNDMKLVKSSLFGIAIAILVFVGVELRKWMLRRRGVDVFHV